MSKLTPTICVARQIGIAPKNYICSRLSRVSTKASICWQKTQPSVFHFPQAILSVAGSLPSALAVVVYRFTYSRIDRFAPFAAIWSRVATADKPWATKDWKALRMRFWWSRNTYLPIQKRPKISPKRSSALNSPVIVLSDNCARRSSSAKSSSCGNCSRAPSICRQVSVSARR